MKVKYSIDQKFASLKKTKKNSLTEQIDALEVQLQEAKNNSAIKDLPLDKIVPNPNQPRQSFYVVEDLKISLTKEGQISPIIVAPLPDSDEYVIF